jgi:AraC family transcriptional regulator
VHDSTPIGKAVWFIESRFAEEISLDDISESAGVSRYQMSRTFSFATGRPVSGYLRGRRLSEAARALAAGAPDILSVAIEAGYGSHEAFTRAFRDLFGMTPEQLRAQRHLDNIELVEPLKMDEHPFDDLEPPRFEDGRPLLIAGLSARYNGETSHAIPAQWQRFAPHYGHVPGQMGEVSYGVCCNSDEAGNFDYICGVEVSDFSDLPPELIRLRIPARRYAVFAHRDHISTIRRTFATIFNKWLPESGYGAADAPEFERYGKEFDPVTGLGGLEVWVPLKS